METLWSSPHLAMKQLDQLGCHKALLKVCHHVFLCFTINGVLVLAFLFLILCEVSVQMFAHVHIQAKNINGLPSECFQILIFWVVVFSLAYWKLELCHREK